MNPLPHAVLVALAICNQHVTAWVSGSDLCLHDSISKTVVMVNGCESKPDGWEPGYESCRVIYEKTKIIRAAEEAATEKREEAAEEAKARAAAKKDQAKLQAAMKALGIKASPLQRLLNNTMHAAPRG